jgi:hypothetical protein
MTENYSSLMFSEIACRLCGAEVLSIVLSEVGKVVSIPFSTWKMNLIFSFLAIFQLFIFFINA